MTLFGVLAPLGFAHSEFHPLAEFGQKFEKAVEGIATRLAPEQGGNFGLIEAENFGGYTKAAEVSNAENVIILRDNTAVAKTYQQNWQRLWDESEPYKK